MKRFVKSILTVSTIVFLMGFLFSYAYAQYLDSSSFSIENPLVGIMEGGMSTSSSFQYVSSSGQLENGQSSSTNFTSNAGFLYFPIATTPVVATTAGNSTVLVSWTASVGTLANVTSYTVGVSTVNGGPYTYTNVGNVTSYNNTGLTNGTTYYFKIRAYVSGLIVSESVQVSGTPVGSIGTTTGGSGGGGGATGVTTGATGGDTVGTGRITFSGRAYPSSRVSILKDGVLAVSTVADPLASFSVSINSLPNGNYNFSVFGYDTNERKSTAFSFPVYITENSTINIGGIFLSPTIDIDKSVVKQGENVAIFGQSVPESDVTISVHSAQEFFNKVKTDKNGVYLLNFDTTPLEIGNHTAKSKSAYATEVSPFGNTVAFKVGTETKIKEAVTCSTLRGDLNCDKKVNLVDFSIMAFWYKKSSPPVNVDLNKDGVISLVDFSIIAFNWTG
jgi:hypothetical protein